MKKQKVTWIKRLFITTAIYDAIFGLSFLFFANTIFNIFDVAPPNHMGYIQFPALILVVFAAMFWQISLNPINNRFLIPYGIGLKFSYTSVVLYHYLTADIPKLWFPFAFIDLIYLVLFFIAFSRLDKSNVKTKNDKIIS